MTTPPNRRPTLDEVARLAGVSRSAASRAINRSGHASRATREAVERAVRELGYVPNPTARALATRQSGAVVLAISHHDSELFADPFYDAVFAGVSAALERTDLLLMLALADSELGRARLERVLRSRHADGIMLMGLHGDDPLYHLAGKLDLPVVYGGRPLNAEPAWYVDADNRGGARLAAEHLIGIGRRRIATLTGALDTYVGAARLGGFQDALAVAGLAPGLVKQRRLHRGQRRRRDEPPARGRAGRRRGLRRLRQHGGQHPAGAQVGRAARCRATSPWSASTTA